MKHACLILVFVSLVIVPPAFAQSAQSSQRADRIYESATAARGEETNLRVEPMDNQRVRVGSWEAQGFSVTVGRFGTRIRSTGPATNFELRPGGLTVESVEWAYVSGRLYLFLRNMR
jgi:hypothetical protein